MKVRNAVSPRTGREVPNQFIIEDCGQIYFQSYESLIAKTVQGKLVLGRHWDYSNTTMKYLREFLQEYFFSLFRGDFSAKNIRKLIADGTVQYDETMA